MSDTDLNSLTNKTANTPVYIQVEINHIVEQFVQQESPFAADSAYLHY